MNTIKLFFMAILNFFSVAFNFIQVRLVLTYNIFIDIKNFFFIEEAILLALSIFASSVCYAKTHSPQKAILLTLGVIALLIARRAVFYAMENFTTILKSPFVAIKIVYQKTFGKK